MIPKKSLRLSPSFAILSLAVAVVLSSAAVAQTAAQTAVHPAAKAARPLPKVEKVTVNAPVTLTDNGTSWTLDNGIVKLSLAKRDVNLSSIVYHGVEVLSKGNYSYWEQRPGGTITSSVTIDPATNGGERAEVSVKGVNSGTPGGRGGEAEGIPDFSTQRELDGYIANLESDMREAAKKFEFERAVKLRDTIKELRTKEFLFS
jgi:hypothetical protein